MDPRLAAPLLAASLALACIARRPVPPGATGAEIYALQSCAACHGERGEGSSRAPALRGLVEHWTVERLAGYFVDPRAFVAADPRLAAVDERYPLRMPVYDNLTPEQARLLAGFVLGLEAAPADAAAAR